jgi:hypothetical protein
MQISFKLRLFEQIVPIRSATSTDYWHQRFCVYNVDNCYQQLADHVMKRINETLI